MSIYHVVLGVISISQKVRPLTGWNCHQEQFRQGYPAHFWEGADNIHIVDWEVRTDGMDSNGYLHEILSDDYLPIVLLSTLLSDVHRIAYGVEMGQNNFPAPGLFGNLPRQ
jgi:hypothetical protein